jgi:hypothetical protein
MCATNIAGIAWTIYNCLNSTDDEMETKSEDKSLTTFSNS